MPSQTVRVTIQLPCVTARALDAIARRRSITRGALCSTLIEEAVRRELHPCIDFHPLPDGGRMAYLRGTRLPVHEAVDMVKRWRTSKRAAKQHDVPALVLEAAMQYAAAYPQEIDGDRAFAHRRFGGSLTLPVRH